jgi:hypothetical protein
MAARDREVNNARKILTSRALNRTRNRPRTRSVPFVPVKSPLAPVPDLAPLSGVRSQGYLRGRPRARAGIVRNQPQTCSWTHLFQGVEAVEFDDDIHRDAPANQSSELVGTVGPL